MREATHNSQSEKTETRRWTVTLRPVEHLLGQPVVQCCLAALVVVADESANRMAECKTGSAKQCQQQQSEAPAACLEWMA